MGYSPWGHKVKVAQLCATLFNPTDYSLPGYPIHGIFQARVLEWVAISFSRASSQPGDRTRVSHIAGRRFNLWAHTPKYMGECPRLYASTTPFYIRDLSIWELWCLQRSRSKSPCIRNNNCCSPQFRGSWEQDRNGVLSTYLMLYKACSFPRNSSQIFPTVVIILCGGFNIAFGHFLLIHHDFNLASWVSTRHLLGSWTSVKPEELQVAMNFFSEDSTLQCTSQPSHSPAINALENSADNMIRDIHRDNSEALKLSAVFSNTKELFNVWCWFMVLMPPNYFKITLYDIIFMVFKPTAWEGTRFGSLTMVFSARILLLGGSLLSPVTHQSCPVPFPPLAKRPVWATLVLKTLRPSHKTLASSLNCDNKLRTKINQKAPFTASNKSYFVLDL